MRPMTISADAWRVERLESRVQVLTAKLERAQVTSLRRKRAVEAERDRVKRRDARIAFLEDQVREAADGSVGAIREE